MVRTTDRKALWRNWRGLLAMLVLVTMAALAATVSVAFASLPANQASSPPAQEAGAGTGSEPNDVGAPYSDEEMPARALGACNPVQLTGSITTADPIQTGRLFRDATPDACASPGPCGDPVAGSYHYDVYNFQNQTGAAACVVVTINTACAGNNFVYSGAYVPSFNPGSICANFVGSSGSSPNPSVSYSFQVPAGATFAVNVHEVVANAGCPQYQLTVSGGTLQYNDVPSTNAFYPFIGCLACRGIISGYNDTTSCPPTTGGPPCFRWENSVTRGQLAKIVSEAAGFTEDPGVQIFTDVPSSNPFYTWINRLARRGYISGYNSAAQCPTGVPCFRWEWNATRGQISKVVSEAARFTEDPGAQIFTDVPSSNAFYAWINRLARRGIISGYNDPVTCAGVGTPCFRWERNATRGQSSKIVANAFYPNCTALAGP